MSCLTAMDAGDGLNAFVHKTPEIALEQARAADARIKAGEAPAMCGIPLGIKDLFCTKGVPSQAASNILKGFKPEYEVDRDLAAVRRGRGDAGQAEHGRVRHGIVERDQSCYGNAVNPWRREGSNVQLTPGGSSGGSAAAVAADLCLAATGTDTGRLDPAAGGVHRDRRDQADLWAGVALGDRGVCVLPGSGGADDQDGARCGDHAAGDVRGMTRRIPRQRDIPVPDFEAALTGDIRGKVIGIPKEYRMDGMPAEIEALWARGIEMLKDAGAEVRDISLPHTKYALPAYYVIAPAEASSNLARYDGVRYGHRAKLAQGDGITEMYEKTRAEGFGPEVQRRVMVGTYVLSAGFYDAYYNRARKVRALIKRDFEVVFAEGVDAILTPATPSAAFGLGEMADADPVQMYLNDVFTVTVNLAGLPGIAVPVGLDGQGLPLGLQLIGRPWDEAQLLNYAHVLESRAGFVAKPEKWW